MKKYSVYFEKTGHVAMVDEGSTVLEAAHGVGVELDHVCGGACACATCHVIIREGHEKLAMQTFEELDMLDAIPNKCSQSRLACQTEVFSDLTVVIPS